MDSHQEIVEKNDFLDTALISQENLPESGKVPISRDEFLLEAKNQAFLAGPLLVVNVFTSLIQTISVMFVGHVGSELALSGASIATSFAIVTGFSLLVSSENALGMFCGQSYGEKQYNMLGIQMQRAMFVLLLICIPQATIWANTGQILVLLGQDQHISADAGLYICYLIPGIFAYALLRCQLRFLGGQNNVVPIMVTTGLTTLLHVLICWALVLKSGLGSKGAALANSVSYWINVLLLGLYLRYSPSCNTTWNGFSTKPLHDVLMFIRLVVPSALIMCLEILACEAVVIFTGLLLDPTLETSVTSTRLSTLVMISTIPLGLGAAASKRVSNAGPSVEARRAVRVGMSMAVMESIYVATTIIIGRTVVGCFYRREDSVVTYVGDMMVLIAATHLFDGLQCVDSGVARGCGWKKIGIYVNLGAFVLIGIPVGALLAFLFHGLWFGIVVAVCVQALILLAISVRSNWGKSREGFGKKLFLK